MASLLYMTQTNKSNENYYQPINNIRSHRPTLCLQSIVMSDYFDGVDSDDLLNVLFGA